MKLEDDQVLGNDKVKFFNEKSLFYRASTKRSMSVKLKTMKTSDVDM